jgi:hypothetical protein
MQDKKTDFVFYFFLFVFLFLFLGWAKNVYEIFIYHDPVISGKLLLRVTGVIVAPLGSVLGFLDFSY